MLREDFWGPEKGIILWYWIKSKGIVSDLKGKML